MGASRARGAHVFLQAVVGAQLWAGLAGVPLPIPGHIPTQADLAPVPCYRKKHERGMCYHLFHKILCQNSLEPLCHCSDKESQKK